MVTNSSCNQTEYSGLPGFVPIHRFFTASLPLAFRDSLCLPQDNPQGLP